MAEEIIEKTEDTAKREVLSREVNDGLEMVRLREQIDQMQLADAIAASQQNYQIARQGYRVA